MLFACRSDLEWHLLTSIPLRHSLDKSCEKFAFRLLANNEIWKSGDEIPFELSLEIRVRPSEFLNILFSNLSTGRQNESMSTLVWVCLLRMPTDRRTFAAS